MVYTELTGIETLAKNISKDWKSGELVTWSQTWDKYKSTIGTISIQESIPTGQVVAEILDLLEGS